MGIFRRGVYGLFTLLLLASLIGSASAMGLRLTVGDPGTMKIQLKESGFYKSFSGILIEQAKSTSMGGNGDADFNNPLVQKAASDALSEEFLETQGNAFIDGNYKWLSGETEKPEYKIDLGPAREKFAQNTGFALASRLASLPTCTNTQLAQIKSQGSEADPYTLECLPFTTNPDQTGEEVAQSLSENSSFLNNAVLTPESLDPSQQTSSQPYYESMANIPKVYQLILVAPFILLGIALFSAFSMLLFAPTKRRALRRISIMLFISSIFLIFSKLIMDALFRGLQNKVNSGSSDSPELQKSILNLAQGTEKLLTSYNVYFGIAFLVLAIIIFALIKRGASTRRAATPVHELVPQLDTPFVPHMEHKPTPLPQRSPQPSLPQPTPTPQPVRKKRPPRLIQ